MTKETERCIRVFAEQQGAEIIELSIQIDHVHLLVSVLPKVSISNFVDTLKGRTAIRIFNKFRNLKNKPYWGNHFWSRGYCVDTVGLDSEMVKKYVQYQDHHDAHREQQGRLF